MTAFPGAGRTLCQRALATADLWRAPQETRALRENLALLGVTGWHSLVEARRFYLSRRLTLATNEALLRAPAPRIRRYVEAQVAIESREYWQACREHRGPLLIVTPHYGPFALGLLKVCLELGSERRVNAFYDPPQRNPGTACYGEILRKCCDNFRPVFNDRRGGVRALQALRNGEVLTMMPDVYELNGQCLLVPFLSQLTYAMSGTAFLALKSGALIVHGYVESSEGGQVRIRFEQPYFMQVTGDDDYDIYRQTSRLLHGLEGQLRRSPAHWVYLSQLRGRLDAGLADADNPGALRRLAGQLGRHLGIETREEILYAEH